MASSTRSQAERLWLVGGGLVAGLVVLLGYLLLVGPQRSETSAVNGRLAAARSQNTALERRIVSLQAQSKSMTSVENQLAAAQRALPSTSGIPDFLRTLQTLGNSTATHVTSVTVGAPTDVSTIASGASTSTGTSASTATTGAAASSAPSSNAAAGSTVMPTGPSVYSITISAQVNGAPTALNQFLAQLQSVQPRAVLVTQISESAGSSAVGGAASGNGTGLQLTMQAFVAPTGASESANLAAASH